MDSRWRSKLDPSGETFINQLILFIDSRGSQLISQKSALKLQPRALEYLAFRVASLRDLQKIKTTNPMDFIAGAVSDLGTYKHMEKIQVFLENVKHLKLYSSAQGIRDPTPVDLTPFQSLVILEMRGCDLSTRTLMGLQMVRSKLQKVICQDTLESLNHLLAPIASPLINSMHSYANTSNNSNNNNIQLSAISDTGPDTWDALTHLSCSYNDIYRIDASLNLCPNLISLDLSRNHIRDTENLGRLRYLAELDLSFNKIESLGQITECCTGLSKLYLQGNRIKDVSGIDRLQHLKILDLRFNVIIEIKDLMNIGRISSLKDIQIEGNPLSLHPNYRHHVLACFQDPEYISLDGKCPSHAEIKKISKFTIARDGEVLENLTPKVLHHQSKSLWSSFFKRIGIERGSSSNRSEEGTHPLSDSSESGFNYLTNSSSLFPDITGGTVVTAAAAAAPGVGNNSRTSHRPFKRIVEISDPPEEMMLKSNQSNTPCHRAKGSMPSFSQLSQHKRTLSGFDQLGKYNIQDLSLNSTLTMNTSSSNNSNVNHDSIELNLSSSKSSEMMHKGNGNNVFVYSSV